MTLCSFIKRTYTQCVRSEKSIHVAVGLPQLPCRRLQIMGAKTLCCGSFNGRLRGIRWQSVCGRLLRYDIVSMPMSKSAWKPRSFSLRNGFPNNSPRVLAHRCSRAIACNLDGQAGCIRAPTRCTTLFLNRNKPVHSSKNLQQAQQNCACGIFYPLRRRNRAPRLRPAQAKASSPRSRSSF